MPNEFIQRLKRALLLGLPLSMVMFVLDWVGYERKWNSAGQIRPISEIWWHLPLTFGAFVILALLLLPRTTRANREE